ncbi:hypothetical protein FDUTEX481_09061 [Tolypothrix sp. PCC 7601]|nr:hypothetical protein FDUTEX481_09061 [Tolypothrix sp. PCC 7601]
MGWTSCPPRTGKMPIPQEFFFMDYFSLTMPVVAWQALNNVRNR